MRKLLCMLTFLLCLTLPVLAESDVVPASLVGEWVPVLSVREDGMTSVFTDHESMIITADGFLSFDHEEAPVVPIRKDAETNDWHCEGALLRPSGSILFIVADTETLVYARADAAPITLPDASPAVCYEGIWRVLSLGPWHASGDGFACFVPFWQLCDEQPAITLPRSVTLETLQQAWSDALAQLDPQSPIQALNTIYGWELISTVELLLNTPYGAISLLRIEYPEVDKDISARARRLEGWWRFSELTVGGIPMPAEALGFPYECLSIDRLGFYTMDGSEVQALQMVDGQVCIGQYPVDVYGDVLYMTLADGVEVRFITEAAWYRQQITGTWRLSKVKVPALNMENDVDSEALDVTLIIPEEGDVILRINGEETSCTLESTDDVIEYLLVGEETSRLTISSLSTLRIHSESDSYTLWFKPVE